MELLSPLLATVVEPAVAASTLLVWLAASLLAAAAQPDRPTGPAPRANSRVAASSLLLVRFGLTVAAVQVVAAGGVLTGSVPDPDASLAWPALVASVTGAAVAAGAWRPLARLRSGRAITDVARFHRLHASLRTGVVAGALAVLAAVLGSGLAPAGGSPGPYLAPTLAVGAVVLGAHLALRAGAVPR